MDRERDRGGRLTVGVGGRAAPAGPPTPIAQALWSLGFVALLLHVSPYWERWPRGRGRRRAAD
ncbi:hypothetical protein ACFVRB_04910 [Streptomyces nojiriensis]|uniref:hypothetical protein n=1 Tax=Streptomyces nojiriensis TaxID=66374 RepID=UPI0036DBAC0A